MSKRIFGVASAVGLVALIAFGVFALAGGMGSAQTASDSGAREAACLAGSSDCHDTGGAKLGVCAQDTPNCTDTAVNDGSGGEQICIPPEEGGPVHCKDGGGSGSGGVPVCPPDHPECSDSSCSVSSDGQVRCDTTPPGSGGGSGSSEPSPPGFSGCGTHADCEKVAIEAAWSLLERDGVSGEITFVSAKGVDWPNACLGVTDADIACAEVVTPGFVVMLQRNGQSYECHADLNGNAVAAQ